MTMYSRVPDYEIALVEQGREEARAAVRHVAEVIGGESFAAPSLLAQDGGRASTTGSSQAYDPSMEQFDKYPYHRDEED